MIPGIFFFSPLVYSKKKNFIVDATKRSPVSKFPSFSS